MVVAVALIGETFHSPGGPQQNRFLRSFFLEPICIDERAGEAGPYGFKPTVGVYGTSEM